MASAATSESTACCCLTLASISVSLAGTITNWNGGGTGVPADICHANTGAMSGHPGFIEDKTQGGACFVVHLGTRGYMGVAWSRGEPDPETIEKDSVSDSTLASWERGTGKGQGQWT